MNRWTSLIEYLQYPSHLPWYSFRHIYLFNSLLVFLHTYICIINEFSKGLLFQNKLFPPPHGVANTVANSIAHQSWRGLKEWMLAIMRSKENSKQISCKVEWMGDFYRRASKIQTTHWVVYSSCWIALCRCSYSCQDLSIFCAIASRLVTSHAVKNYSMKQAVLSISWKGKSGFQLLVFKCWKCLLILSLLRILLAAGCSAATTIEVATLPLYVKF